MAVANSSGVSRPLRAGRKGGVTATPAEREDASKTNGGPRKGQKDGMKPDDASAAPGDVSVGKQISITKSAAVNGAATAVIRDSAATCAETVDASTAASASASAESTTALAATVPPRRQTTRTRKPSSRLLPSPSPPPPQRSSYYNYLNKGASAGATSTPAAPSNKARKSQSSEPKAMSSVSPMAEPASMANPSNPIEALGPGKRKRRPSTMTKPPSTITKAPSPAPTSTWGSASKERARSPIKVDNSADSTTHRPSSTAAAKTARKAKNEILESTTDGAKRNSIVSSAAYTIPAASSGYESDGNAEGAMLQSLAGPDDADAGDDESDSGIHFRPPSRPISATARRSLLTNSRGKVSSRGSSQAGLEPPPPLISRRGGLKGHPSALRALSKTDVHATSPSAARAGRWSWHGTGASLPLLRFKLDNVEARAEDEDSSAAEDEDDFHVAMLSGCDIDLSSDTEMRKPTLSPSLKGSPPGSRSFDGSDSEYTPATTPQSPRSTCDGPERRSSAERDTGKPSGANTHDAVFAHALEPSSRRPHTHAGALTLSLPFEDMMQVPEEESSAMPMPKGGKDQSPFVAGGGGGGVVKQEDTQDDDEGQSTGTVKASESPVSRADETTIEADLLGSPAHHPLGAFPTKKRSLLALTSPNPCSTFPSPNLTSARAASILEPTPLRLPLASVAPNYGDEGEGDSKKRLTARMPAMPVSAEDDDMEEDATEHVFGRAASGFYPPESLCLSDLDKAWEQNERLAKLRGAGGLNSPLLTDRDIDFHSAGHDTPSSEADVEQLVEAEAPKDSSASRPADTPAESDETRVVTRHSAKSGDLPTVNSTEETRSSKRARRPTEANDKQATKMEAAAQQSAPSTRRTAAARRVSGGRRSAVHAKA